MMCLPFHSPSLQLRVSQRQEQDLAEGSSTFPSLRSSCRSAETLASGNRAIAFHKKNREAINPDMVYLLKNEGNNTNPDNELYVSLPQKTS